MSFKQKTVLICVWLAVAFAFGRYSVKQQSIKTVAEVDTSKDISKDIHTVTTITKTENPDGTVKTITNIDSNTKIDEQDSTVTKIKQDIIDLSRPSFNVSALVANDFSKSLHFAPEYGISITTEILGPVTVGVFGLFTSKTAGASIGVNF